MARIDPAELRFLERRDRSSEDADGRGPRVIEMSAWWHGQQVGELRYWIAGDVLFVVGIAVRYEYLRHGVASALLDEIANRLPPGCRLAANSERENTFEGNALLHDFELRTGMRFMRVDQGLDGDR